MWNIQFLKSCSKKQKGKVVLSMYEWVICGEAHCHVVISVQYCNTLSEFEQNKSIINKKVLVKVLLQLKIILLLLKISFSGYCCYDNVHCI